MTNEIVLSCTLILLYSGVVIFFRLFGKTGLYMWTAVAAISANIEALILVEAFGLEQTSGNVLFASTFLVTDILSETSGRQSANKAVKIGIAVNILFLLISQSWFLYQPSPGDWASPAIREVFSNTPRLMITSLCVYAIVQAFDVFAYHAIWKRTTKIFGDSRKGLWIRNNAATLLSQLMNTVLFTFGAFWGTYDLPTLLSICASSYIIFIVTSLLDTPAVYIARRLKEKGRIPEE